MPLTTVVVPRGKIRFPDFCPVCLRPYPEWVQKIASNYGNFSGYYVFFARSKHLVMEIPVCAPCVRKNRRIQGYGLVATVIGLLMAVATMQLFHFGNAAWWIVGPLFVLPGILAYELLGKPVRIGSYDAQTIEFRFKNLDYARKFKAMNQPVLPTQKPEGRGRLVNFFLRRS